MSKPILFQPKTLFALATAEVAIKCVQSSSIIVRYINNLKLPHTVIGDVLYKALDLLEKIQTVLCEKRFAPHQEVLVHFPELGRIGRNKYFRVESRHKYKNRFIFHAHSQRILNREMTYIYVGLQRYALRPSLRAQAATIRAKKRSLISDLHQKEREYYDAFYNVFTFNLEQCEYRKKLKLVDMLVYYPEEEEENKK